MIIKSSRVLPHDGREIAQYFEDQGENECVSWLLGEGADVELMALTARLGGKLFGVRHFVIAPELPLSTSDLSTVLSEIANEYNVSRISFGQACLVRHRKPETGAGGCDTHFHLAVPEWDLRWGRVMSSRFSKMRDEKIARILELKLGHPPIVGRFNRVVYDAIGQEQPSLDLSPFENALRATAVAHGLSEECWKDVQAIAPNAHAKGRWRKALENGLDLPASVRTTHLGSEPAYLGSALP